jgi:hypothetical protein
VYCGFLGSAKQNSKTYIASFSNPFLKGIIPTP